MNSSAKATIIKPVEYIKNIWNSGRRILAEDEVKAILRAYGLPVTKYVVIKPCESVENELQAARAMLQDENLTSPVAMKICTHEVLHKSDVGGVVLGVTEAEFSRTYLQLREKFPKTPILIESMENPGVEVIIGLHQDATFGLCIMLGLGGIFTELLRDVTFRLVPIEVADAEEMLTELRGRRLLLEGFRHMKVNKNLLISLLLKVSELGMQLDRWLDQLDLNPIFLRMQDAVVVDAKLILKEDTGGEAERF